jgi:hypothetical protein
LDLIRRNAATKGEAALAETLQASSRATGDLSQAKRENETLMQVRRAAHKPHPLNRVGHILCVAAGLLACFLSATIRRPKPHLKRAV